MPTGGPYTSARPADDLMPIFPVLRISMEMCSWRPLSSPAESFDLLTDLP